MHLQEHPAPILHQPRRHSENRDTEDPWGQGTLGEPPGQVHDLWIFGCVSPYIPITDSLTAFSDTSNASTRGKYTLKIKLT